MKVYWWIIPAVATANCALLWWGFVTYVWPMPDTTHRGIALLAVGTLTALWSAIVLVLWVAAFDLSKEERGGR